MKFMRSFILVVLCALFMCSCASRQIVPPAGCENSILYSQLGNQLLEVDAILKVANVVAIKEDVYTRAQALNAIDNLILVLNSNPSYLDFGMMVWEMVEDVNQTTRIEVLLVSEYLLESFNSPIPIDPCDKDLIVLHLEKQKRLIMLL